MAAMSYSKFMNSAGDKDKKKKKKKDKERDDAIRRRLKRNGSTY